MSGATVSTADCPLHVAGASLSFGAVRALEDVTLHVGAGEVYALVGPNGAGKSSLVRAICGRVLLASGTISIGGARVGSRDARRSIGVAPQKAALFDKLTALENVSCFARLAGVSAAESDARAAAALKLTGLAPENRTFASRLSGGQRQRANIAAAIVHAPALLVLDEPAASLDPEGVAETNALIEQVRSENMAILIVTHDMAQADQLASRVGVISGGRIIVEGTTEKLKARFGGDGLRVSIDADAVAANNLTQHGYIQDRQRIWHGRAASQMEVAALVERVTNSGGVIRSVETALPSLAIAIDAALKELSGQA
jgi:ABC-2 type transport system ATP-binding protein